MKIFKQISTLFVLFIALTGQTLAAEDCGPDAIDPDDDGWGWENGMSCRIVVAGPTYCQLEGSDPDGDGWGWENNASCRVKPGSTTGPGSSINSAGTVQIGTAINATMNGISQHFYQFQVADNTAIELITSYLISGSITTYITDGQNTYLEPAYGRQSVCLGQGTYYLILDRSYVDTVNTIDYSVTINTTELNCVAPVTTVFGSTNDNFSITEDGSIYKQTWDSSYNTILLSKVDNTGATLWTTASDYIDSIASAQNDSVLVSSYESLSLLDSQGQLVWSNSNGDTYTSALTVGSQAVILARDDTLLAYNLSDGSLRWRYDLPQYNYVNEITINADGQVAVSLGQTVLIFDE